jgi:hypothetical protein
LLEKKKKNGNGVICYKSIVADKRLYLALMAIGKKVRLLSGSTQACYLVWVAWESNWEHVSNQVMEFLPCVQLNHDLHSVSMGLVVRVRYVRTCPLEFQHTLSEC